MVQKHVTIMAVFCFFMLGRITATTSTVAPSFDPTLAPSALPTSASPSMEPTSASPSMDPSLAPSALPTSASPSADPSLAPSAVPTLDPTFAPSTLPTFSPSGIPTQPPTAVPTTDPTFSPSGIPTQPPTYSPSTIPTQTPSYKPTQIPSSQPSSQPSCQPSNQPSLQPFVRPTSAPSYKAETWGEVVADGKRRRRMGGLCENHCSHHGTCEMNNNCKCFVGLDGEDEWTGPDCSLRTCPKDFAWVGEVVNANGTWEIIFHFHNKTKIHVLINRSPSLGGVLQQGYV